MTLLCPKFKNHNLQHFLKKSSGFSWAFSFVLYFLLSEDNDFSYREISPTDEEDWSYHLNLQPKNFNLTNSIKSI